MDEEELTKELFPFKKPLTSRYRKKYVEFLAVGILQYCYDGTYEGYDVYDAPDIRDKTKTVGIEVTEAITIEQAQIESEFVKYRLENNEEKKNNFVDDFQNFFVDSFFSNKALKTDIIENDKEYVLKVELPGVDKKNINLDFNNQYLTLSVNQEEEKEEKEQRFIRKERSRFSYSRSYYLDKACEEKIKAKMDNGILTITVGKAEEEIKKSISID